MSSYRWTPHVLLQGEELKNCLKFHFKPTAKILLIMSKGFDVRMNIALQELKSNPKELDIECLLINFDEGINSSSHQYAHLVEENMKELYELLPKNKINNANIQLWINDGRSKRRVGDRKASSIINEVDLNRFSDIIVDISALPRGIYFSMIGKLLTLIDEMQLDKQPNLMITVAENSELDMVIHDDVPDDEPNFLHG